MLQFLTTTEYTQQYVRTNVNLSFYLIHFPQILGTGINSSGSLAPPNAPVAEAQVDAMRRAFSQANRNPSDVDFVELHSTGKRLLFE